MVQIKLFAKLVNLYPVTLLIVSGKCRKRLKVPVYMAMCVAKIPSSPTDGKARMMTRHKFGSFLNRDAFSDFALVSLLGHTPNSTHKNVVDSLAYMPEWTALKPLHPDLRIRTGTSH